MRTMGLRTFGNIAVTDKGQGISPKIGGWEHEAALGPNATIFFGLPQQGMKWRWRLRTRTAKNVVRQFLGLGLTDGPIESGLFIWCLIPGHGTYAGGNREMENTRLRDQQSASRASVLPRGMPLTQMAQPGIPDIAYSIILRVLKGL